MLDDTKYILNYLEIEWFEELHGTINHYMSLNKRASGVLLIYYNSCFGHTLLQRILRVMTGSHEGS